MVFVEEVLKLQNTWYYSKDKVSPEVRDQMAHDYTRAKRWLDLCGIDLEKYLEEEKNGR